MEMIFFPVLSWYEVGERIASGPHSKTNGFLTISVRFRNPQDPLSCSTGLSSQT